MKKHFFYLPVKIFAVGYLLNLVWEWGHSGLYNISTMTGVPFFLNLIIAFSDAFAVTFVIILTIHLRHALARWLVLISVPCIFSFTSERIATSQGLFAYTSAMPIVPLLGVGVSPLLQLAVTTAITYALFRKPLAELQS